jgi:hypothetical protein
MASLACPYPIVIFTRIAAKRGDSLICAIYVLRAGFA